MSVTTVVIIIPSRYAPTEPWSIENDIRKQKVAVVSTRNDLQTQTVMLKKKYGGKHCSEPKST